MSDNNFWKVCNILGAEQCVCSLVRDAGWMLPPGTTGGCIRHTCLTVWLCHGSALLWVRDTYASKW